MPLPFKTAIAPHNTTDALIALLEKQCVKTVKDAYEFGTTFKNENTSLTPHAMAKYIYNLLTTDNYVAFSTSDSLTAMIMNILPVRSLGYISGEFYHEFNLGSAASGLVSTLIYTVTAASSGVQRITTSTLEAAYYVLVIANLKPVKVTPISGMTLCNGSDFIASVCLPAGVNGLLFLGTVAAGIVDIDTGDAATSPGLVTGSTGTGGCNSSTLIYKVTTKLPGQFKLVMAE